MIKQVYDYLLFVCLGYYVPLENISLFEDVTITSEGLKIGTHDHWAVRVL